MNGARTLDLTNSSLIRAIHTHHAQTFPFFEILIISMLFPSALFTFLFITQRESTGAWYYSTPIGAIGGFQVYFMIG